MTTERKPKYTGAYKKSHMGANGRMVTAKMLRRYRVVDGRLEKQCSGCENWMPPTSKYWHPSKKTSDGLHGWCKVCLNTQRKANRETYQERLQREARASGTTVWEKMRERARYERERRKASKASP